MNDTLLGKWVEVTLVNDKKWTGILQEWDEEALFISEGIKFGQDDHKGAECTNEEVSKVIETSKREFEVS